MEIILGSAERKTMLNYEGKWMENELYVVMEGKETECLEKAILLVKQTTIDLITILRFSQFMLSKTHSQVASEVSSDL